MPARMRGNDCIGPASHPMDHLVPYIAIGMIVVAAAAFAVVNALLGRLLGPRRDNPSKALPYESGMIPKGEANVRIPVKFYMVSLLFLLFDIETVFILAWALVFRGKALDFDSGALPFTQGQFQAFAFFEMLVFIAILMVGYAYVWRKGGLEWS